MAPQEQGGTDPGAEELAASHRDIVRWGETPKAHWLLELMVGGTVFLEIFGLYQRYQATSGIDAWRVAEAVAFGPVLGEKGDQLLFPGKETHSIFTGLCRALAIMSFVPGGIRFCSERHEALSLLSRRYGSEEAARFCQIALQPYAEAAVGVVPMTCWAFGNEPLSLGSYNALPWLEGASDADLLELGEASYQGHGTPVSKGSAPSTLDQRLIAFALEQALRIGQREPGQVSPSQEILAARRLLEARDSAREIAFQVDQAQAEKWLFVYRHLLMTGERWLLPPESKKPRK